jgi:hypothetical protein
MKVDENGYGILEDSDFVDSYLEWRAQRAHLFLAFSFMFIGVVLIIRALLK